MQKIEKELKLISIKIYKEDYEFLEKILKNKKTGMSKILRELLHRSMEKERAKKMEPNGSIEIENKITNFEK